MTIKDYTLGAGTKSDRDLFAWVGPWLVSRKTHETLGIAITSRPGDRWHVMMPAKGPARGFAVTADAKGSPSRHLRFLHADTTMARRALLARVIDLARHEGIAVLWARERRGDSDLIDAGFKMIDTAETTRERAFVRYELTFKTEAQT
ncbi:hypothetical protein [Pannonibacter tanglangensis]|uniref:Uncharacterized protein n=1 Tax=Pannonibacter tanglangensis TaxID=2750084 RepID=A0ABW9ZFC1_9HYPH|nr:hypothetical protein [Pannonibacter sp. XCT-34]NBN62758.1 hypothetical protein [Pannonibacter sp. XCT-34]